MKLKICGVKTVEEAKALKDAGADYVGLNFVPSSARCITLETAKDIRAVLQGSPVEIVALFRDQPADMVNDYADQLDVDYIQLHGDEPAEYARSLNRPVIKAVAVKPGVSAAELIKTIESYPGAYFVLDRHTQGQGDIVDTGLARQVVDSAPDKVCLAGGLNPDNLADILSKVQPFAIDISSGVRSGDAIDMAKVAQCQQIMRKG